MAQQYGQNRGYGGGSQQGFRQGGGGAPPPGPKPELVLFDPAKPENYHPTLLTEQATKWAARVPKGQGKGALNSHQLRRFYGEFKRIEQKVREDDGNFAKYVPLVAMLKAHAAYASNPKNKKIPTEFRELIETLADQAVKGEREFEAVGLFFQAFVGYCYGEGLE